VAVVITGASGHIGANLVRALVDNGKSVRAVVREDTRSIEGLDVECVKADILDKASLLEAFEGAETVFHLAGFISILERDADRLEIINVEGTRNVVAACLEHKVKRLVYTSSIEALMIPDGPDPIDESVDVEREKLTSAYSRSKYSASLAVLEGVERGLDAVIVHPTAVVGPHDNKPSLFGKAIIDFAHLRLPGFVPGGFDFVDVRDVASGLIAAAEKGRCGERYLLAGSFLTLDKLASILHECTGAPRPRFTIPFWLTYLAALFTPMYYSLSRTRPRFTRQSMKMLDDGRRVSSEKAQKELGYEPHPGEEGVRGAVEWFAENDIIHPVFRSRKDPGIVVFFVAFVLLCVLGGIHQLSLGTLSSIAIGLGALATGLAYAWISWPVRYEITGKSLLVRGGPFRWDIPLEEIREVRPSRNPISAPSWSLKRLRVSYHKGEKSHFVLVSPARQEDFLDKLKSAATHLEIEGNRLLLRTRPDESGNKHLGEKT